MWSQFGQYQERLRAHLSKLRFGPGLRFFLDPLGRGCGVGALPLIPVCEAYRQELAAWLRAHFHDLSEIQYRWALEQAPGSFEEAASLTPLGVEGAKAYLYSRSAGRLLLAQAAHSAYWFDLLRFRDAAVAQRLERLAEVVRAAADVPVVLRYFGGAHHFYCPDDENGETPERSAKPPAGTVPIFPRGADGLAMSAGLPEEFLGLVEGAAAAGLCALAPRTMWSLAIADDLAADHTGGAPDSRGAPSVPAVAALLSAGAKGIFFSASAGAGGLEQRANTAREAQQGERFGQVFPNLAASWKALRGEIEAYRPSFCYWFPASDSSLSAFYPDGGGFLGLDGSWGAGPVAPVNGWWVVPAPRFPARAEAIVLSVQGPPASHLFAGEISSALASSAHVSFLGVRRDQGTIPALDRYFVPEADSSHPAGGSLIPDNECETLGLTPQGGVWKMRRRNLTIVALHLKDHLQVLDWLDLPPAPKYYAPNQVELWLAASALKPQQPVQ